MKTTRRRFIQLTSGLLVPASAYGQLTLRNSSYPTLFKSSASAPFVPSNYGTVWAWYRNSTLSTYASGVWVDSSGNGRDTVQTTGGFRPTYSAASLNGLDALSFDGTDDGLTIGAELAPSNISVVALVRPSLASSSQNAYAPVFIGSYALAGLRICVRIGTNDWGSYVGSDLSCGEQLSAFTNYVLTGISNSTNGTVLQRDGVTKATSASESQGVGSTNAQMGSERGSSRFYAGLVSEMLIYSTELTGSNLTAVNNYMKGLGGIA